MESSEPGRRKTHCRTALILIKTHLLRREHALWGQSLAWDLLSQILDTGPPALLEWAPFLWPQWPLTAAWLDLAVLLQWPSVSGLFIETTPRQVPLVWLGLHTWAVLVSVAKHCYWETDTSCFRYQAQDSMVDVSRPWQGPQPWARDATFNFLVTSIYSFWLSERNTCISDSTLGTWHRIG